MNKNKIIDTKKLVYGALLIALGIILPQIFHLTGSTQSGGIFLPMHIPVLLAGFVTGPLVGAIVGIITPIISSLVTAMPAVPRLYFMIIELMIYGFVSGFCYEKIKNIKYSVYISLILAMIAGRVAYGISLSLASGLLELELKGVPAVSVAIALGIPGIIIQLIFIPPIIFSLEKGGFLNG